MGYYVVQWDIFCESRRNLPPKWHPHLDHRGLSKTPGLRSQQTLEMDPKIVKT